MPNTKPSIPLHLEPVEGPEVKPISLTEIEAATFGRGSACTYFLDHHAVSREHMAIVYREGTWYVTDHFSRNGTRLNGFSLPSGEPAPLADADHLQLGPWTFRIRLGDYGTRIASLTVDDDAATSQRLRTTGITETDPRIRQQFTSLLRASALLHSAKDESELLESLLQTAQSATGFERAAVIRRTESLDSVEVVAQLFRGDHPPNTPKAFHFSRSLLRAAQNGPFAVVSEGLPSDRPETMIKLDIAAAACAPIRLNEAIWGYLYLDSGSGTPPTGAGELIELARSLADIASLALVRVKQQEVGDRLRALQGDVEAAAEIQRFLLPQPSGCIASVRYAMRSKPGRLVSGDIFDIIELPNGRVAALMGDVMGKGLGAGLVMSSVQSFLHSVLRVCPDPAKALEELNAFLTPRISVGRFVSLWLGVFDRNTRTLVAADAGHGYCILISPDGKPSHFHCAGGTPIAAQEHCAYTSTTLNVEPNTRLILFSDGVVEQRSASGDAFGIARLLDTLTTSTGPDEDVEFITRAIDQFAGPVAPSDDLTAASLLFSE